MVSEKERITKTLGDDNKKYYVYMLCEKLKSGEVVPFYIGKGEKERVWAHEQEQELKELKELKEKAEKNENNKDDAIYYQKEIETINEKYKKIEEIKKSGEEVLKVIVKWGLTNDEAYMAESALINMYKFINKDKKLTNIVNGHMSEKEKKNPARETKARDLEDFAKNCAIDKVSIEKVTVPIYMADIAKTYYKKRDLDNPSNDDNVIYDCARSAWVMAEEKLKFIEYVFALVAGKVVGIYKVNKDSWLRIRDTKEKGYVHPKYEFDEDNNFLALYDKYGKDIEKGKLACEQLGYDKKKYQEWGKRFCFEKQDTDIEPEIMSFKDKILEFPNGRTQNEHYNFDINRNKAVLKKYEPKSNKNENK